MSVLFFLFPILFCSSPVVVSAPVPKQPPSFVVCRCFQSGNTKRLMVNYSGSVESAGENHLKRKSPRKGVFDDRIETGDAKVTGYLIEKKFFEPALVRHLLKIEAKRLQEVSGLGNQCYTISERETPCYYFKERPLERHKPKR
jgi:hypothetical protein